VGALVVYRASQQRRREPAERSIVVALGQPRTELRPAAPARPSAPPPSRANRPRAAEKPKSAQSAEISRPEMFRESAPSRNSSVNEMGGAAATPAPEASAADALAERKTAPPAPAPPAAQPAVGPPRLAITSQDGLGAPPPQTGASPEIPASARGLEFNITVDAAGRVLAVAPAGAATPRRRAEGALDRSESDTVRLLRRLRFAPGNHTRRLRVRIQ
jgi:hypothetical protein